MKKITKKSFIEALKNGQNEILIARLTLTKKQYKTILKQIINGSFFISEKRTLKKAYSNSLLFSDGSSLYFNTVKKCYRVNNVILTVDSRWSEWEGCYYYSIIAYVIKD